MYVASVPCRSTIDMEHDFDSLVLKGDNHVHIMPDTSSNSFILIFHGIPQRSYISLYGYKNGEPTHLKNDTLLFWKSPWQAYLSGMNGYAFNMARVDRIVFKDSYLTVDRINLINTPIRTTSYRVFCIEPDGERKWFSGECKITDEMYEAIQEMPSGTVVQFVEIVMPSYYGFPIYVDPIILILK